ncbi:hypothetical protein ACQ4M3_37325 [Leptolyngbya sp. AN03gr2]|uniref:hypothetical protein n=1 Tax=unclassified Leptolyngbya TaxID=2650499 RepID=UPI003D322962
MNIQEWTNRPIPKTEAGIREWLSELLIYIEKVGETRAISELAEIDALQGEKPASSHLIYQSVYRASHSLHSSEISLDQ